MVRAETLKNKGFMVKEHGEYLLVHPSRGKFEWEPDELFYRSMLVHAKSGAVVSVGWPKFFNQGEWPEHDAAIAQELEAGRAVITHKHDGSLIIRSVLPDGRIFFRTRDSFDGGKFAPLAEAVARAKYPALLDPEVFPHGSLLFEYVGAGNQIVVRYEGDDDLIFLGAAEHGEPGKNGIRYVPYVELRPLAESLGLRLVETYDWATEGIAATLGMVQGWDKAEGVVVRSSDGQTLLKIKSAWYFAQHALRWHMTYEAICRFCIDGGICDEEGLEKGLAQAGWDFEVISIAKQHFARYCEGRAEAAKVREDALAFLAAFEAETAGQHDDERARRKAFAARLFGADATPESRALASYRFLVYDGKRDRLEATLLRHFVLRPKR